MNIKQMLIKSVNTIHTLFVYLAMVLIIGITLITSTNIFMRFVLSSGLFWAEEVTKILVVWFTYIAMAIGVKQGLHISLHILPKNMPPVVFKILKILKDLITIFIAVIMIVYGTKIIGFTSRSIMPATEWPSSVLYMILPISGVLIIFESVMDLFGIEDSAVEIENLFIGVPDDKK
ncbi:MAG: TRAP transporter small permease [Spirochaetaceae bacterium]